MGESITDRVFSLITPGAAASEPQKPFLENLHMSNTCFFNDVFDIMKYLVCLVY